MDTNEFNKNLAHLYMSRGCTHVLLKDFSAAMSDFDQAINLDPECDGAYANRGGLKLRHLTIYREHGKILKQQVN